MAADVQVAPTVAPVVQVVVVLNSCKPVPLVTPVSVGVVRMGLVSVLFTRVSVPLSVPVEDGFVIVGEVSVLFVSVSVVAAPTMVSAVPLLLIIFQRCPVESHHAWSKLAMPVGAAVSLHSYPLVTELMA